MRRVIYFLPIVVIVNLYLFTFVGFVSASSKFPVIGEIAVGQGSLGITIDSVKNIIYVSNFYDNNISVIDGNSDEVVDTIFVGQHPRDIAVNPTSKKLYVSNMNPDEPIDVINTETYEVIKRLTNVSTARALAVNPTTNSIYATFQLGNGPIVGVMDGNTDEFVKYIRHSNSGMASGIVVNPISNKTYAEVLYNTVSVIDGTNGSNELIFNTPVAAINTGYEGIDVNTSTNKVYVASNLTGQEITVINGADNSVYARIPTLHVFDFSINAADIAANPTTNHIFVPSNNNVLVIDGDTNKFFIDDPIIMNKLLWGVAVNPVTNKVYVLGDGMVYVIQDREIFPPGGGIAPFLDLPWNYESQGKTFDEAALAIQSYFDHEYPFEDVGSVLEEPDYALNSVVNYKESARNFNIRYSNHDGYDWIGKAGVHNGDTVLAAAPGVAVYKKGKDACGSNSCGNTILIDHGNGFQTRYYHLQDGDPIMESFSAPKPVKRGEQIGKVGATGGWDTPHIHFMVVQDKNGDGNFDDNRPDGVTDPFGWHGITSDPWLDYHFFYKGQEKNGNASNYLWLKSIYNFSGILTFSQLDIDVKNYNLYFPQGTADKDLKIDATLSSYAQNDNRVSVYPTLLVKFLDLAGNLITQFSKNFTIKVDFSKLDLSKYNLSSLTIYSSSDGSMWNAEDTVLDLNNKIASTEVNHASYFALMAEKSDTVAPVSNVVLGGDGGEGEWFKSDIKLTLTALDNDGGSGIYYSGYALDDDFFHEYANPIVVSGEGKHTVKYYSVDNNENIEEIKSLEFYIDRTPPSITLFISPEVLWPPDRKMVDAKVWGKASDNNRISKLLLNIDDEYNQLDTTTTISSTNELFNDFIKLEAGRIGEDLDGRSYIIKISAFDLAGNMSGSQAAVLVPHDQGI